MTSLIPGHWGVVAATLVVAHWLSIRQGQALPLQLSYLLPLSKSVRKSKGHFRAPWGYFGNLWGKILKYPIILQIQKPRFSKRLSFWGLKIYVESSR